MKRKTSWRITIESNVCYGFVITDDCVNGTQTEDFAAALTYWGAKFTARRLARLYASLTGQTQNVFIYQVVNGVFDMSKPKYIGQIKASIKVAYFFS